MTTNHSSWPWDVQGDDDPTVTPTPAPIGTQYRRTDNGTVYQKTGVGDTDWTLELATVTTDNLTIVGAGTPASPMATAPPTLASHLLNDCFSDIHVATAVGGTAEKITGDGDRSAGVWKLTTFVAGDAAAASPIADSPSASGFIADYQIDVLTSLRCDVRARVSSTAQSVTEDYRAAIGMASTILGAAQAGTIGAGAVFITSFSDYGDNNWHVLITDDTPTTWTADTGVAVDGLTTTNHRYTITWDKATETWQFYIDGVLTNTIVTAGFLGGQCGPMVGLGDTATAPPLIRAVLVDWFDVLAKQAR